MSKSKQSGSGGSTPKQGTADIDEPISFKGWRSDIPFPSTEGGLFSQQPSSSLSSSPSTMSQQQQRQQQQPSALGLVSPTTSLPIEGDPVLDPAQNDDFNYETEAEPKPIPSSRRRSSKPRRKYFDRRSRTFSTDSIEEVAQSRGGRKGSKFRPFPTPGEKSMFSYFEVTTDEPEEQQKPTTDSSKDDYKSIEELRLEQDERKERHWKRWGPYLAERQWATVREDYSANGDAWTNFPHDHARSRAFRWGEDGLAGISDNHQRLCFSLALWNGKDPFLKERLFGVTGHQGNHGEDVKEVYHYLDSTPTHSYMHYLYKYPQTRYPYEELVRENEQRNREVTEFEIFDTDIFDEDRYWDVFVEYAKDEDNADAMSVRITAVNRGPDAASLHIVPQLFFRNTWSWPKERPTGKDMPSMILESDSKIRIQHKTLGTYYFHINPSESPSPPLTKKTYDHQHNPLPRFHKVSKNGLDTKEPNNKLVIPELLFTNNDTNFKRLYGGNNFVDYVKDAFHDHIVPTHFRPPPDPKENGSSSSTTTATEKESTQKPAKDRPQFVDPNKQGTKAGIHYIFNDVPPNGGYATVRLKLTSDANDKSVSSHSIDQTMHERKLDSDEFYARFNNPNMNDDMANIMRQALAGMLWTKQFYYFVQKEWLEGDPGQPPPPPNRKWIRNKNWPHLHIDNVLSMPDKWEYPFFAIWDTAFHCIPLAMVDPAFAKKQLDLMTREWFMKPDGALPAYEWDFGDVNPPVHAWATHRVFKLERKIYGREDIGFLERVFQKLLLNFTWWVNQKDYDGSNVFEGGFLGLDNIGIFNRSEELPTGGVLRQSDGTAWMAFYSLCMLNMALELAKHNKTYEDIASKFFEHFLFIADAMTFRSVNGDQSLWNDEDGFFYDSISWGPSNYQQLPVRSLVGLIPLYATTVLEPSAIDKLPGFKRRMEWFIENRPGLAGRNIANLKGRGKGDRRLLALANEERLKKILQRLLDEDEFLSEFGIRSLSRYHKDNTYSMNVNGQEFGVEYWPGESKSGMFGGNSNWRGPIWLATTHLIVESLQRFHQYYGHDWTVECPTGSGYEMNLANIANEIQNRIIHIFARDYEGKRAYNGTNDKLNYDPHFTNYINFHEYFHADTGAGLGASHQTGWTGLIAYIIWQSSSTARLPRTPRTPRSTAAHYFDEEVGEWTTPNVSDTGVDNSEEDEHELDLECSELSPDEL